MRLLAGAIVVVLVLVITVLGAWWWAFVTTGELTELLLPRSPSPATAVRPRLPTPLPTRPPVRVSPAPKHVVCTGCEKTPRVTVRPRESVRTAGGITERFRYTPDAYTVRGGKPAHPHELARDVLERQKIGHLLFDVSIPNVGYLIQGTPEESGVYRVRPSDITPAENAAIVVTYSIRYPVLSDAQFSFVRSKKDYRFVYGLIRGVVNHEERHTRALTSYIEELRRVLATPVQTDVVIAASSNEEFHAKAVVELSRVLGERVAAVRRKHERAQDAIDDPAKKAQITFTFEEEVDGEVPPPLIAEFIGEGSFSFALPPGPVPRPPAPSVKW